MSFPIKCTMRADGNVTRVDVYDDIGEGFFGDGLTAKDFSAEIARTAGPLDVHINSGGGRVDDGIAIANAVRAYKGRKRTIVDGMAASIASVIMQAGDERIVEPGSMVMIHDASTDAPIGTQADALKAAAVLGKHSDNIAQQYADRAGGTAEEWREIMRAETWFTAEEAVAAGLADRIGVGTAALPQRFDLAALHAVPGRLVAHLRSMPTMGGPSAPQPTQCSACGGTGKLLNAAGAVKKLGADGWVQDPDGSTRFDPDGDGDDDSTPEGDTDHDYFDPDGKPLKPIPPCPAMNAAHTAATVLNAAADHGPTTATHTHPHPAYAGPEGGADGAHSHEHTHAGDNLHHHTHPAATPATEVGAHTGTTVLNADGVDTSPWDADKAWHNGTTAEDPAAFYEGICAGKRSGDPSTQAAWALPYKYHPSDPPNAAGVRAALSRLSGTPGLINKTEAQNALQAAMKKVNPEWKPGDQIETGLLSAVMLELVKGGRK